MELNCIYIENSKNTENNLIIKIYHYNPQITLIIGPPDIFKKKMLLCCVAILCAFYHVLSK